MIYWTANITKQNEAELFAIETNERDGQTGSSFIYETGC
jgi:hypothetical protein